MEEQLPKTEEVHVEPHDKVINPPVELLDKRHHFRQFIAGILGVLIVVLIAAVAYYFGQNTIKKQEKIIPINGPQPTTKIVKITVPVVIPSETTSSPIETAPESTLGDKLPIKQKNKLLLVTDKTSYKKGSDNIFVTIANGLNQPIYAQDEQTNCKIVALEFLEDTDWKAINDCYLGRLPGTVMTGNERTRVIKLQTKPLPPLPANDPNLFKPGLYRIALTYSFSINGPQFGGELIRPLTIYSPPFMITQ